MNWKDAAKMKQEAREKLLPSKWRATGPLESINDIEKYLTPEEIEITNSSGVDLVPKLKAGELKVRTVVEAFCHRSTLAQQLTNCLTEILFDDALARADELDASDVKEGLLFGLPVSVKDSLNIKGYDSTIGYMCNVNEPATTESVYYHALLSQGAMVIAKTNIPQTLMCAESVNYVWGRTTNPYNAAFGAGGSSGGEGAILACRGVVIGTGTDIAGSIRMPALCEGICGVRPSACRLPLAGNQAPSRGAGSEVLPVIGPMANNTRDVELGFKAVNMTKPWLRDTTLYPQAWRDLSEAPKKFKVGVISSWGVVSHPPVQRAMDKVISKLRAAGHSVVELTDIPTDAETAEREQTFCNTLTSLDSFKSVFNKVKLGEEPVHPLVEKMGWTKLPKYSVEDVIVAREHRTSFINSVLSSFNKHLPDDYDVILCPPAPHTSVKHDSFLYWWYTAVWNYVDLPAAVIPVTFVDPALDKPRKLESDNALATYIESLYDPEEMAGLPVTVQLVGRRFRDEELLKTVIAIEDLLKV